MLLSLPGVTADDVQRFEEKLQQSGQNPTMKSSKLEKVKKDVFKKLIIEVNIGAAVFKGKKWHWSLSSYSLCTKLGRDEINLGELYEPGLHL